MNADRMREFFERAGYHVARTASADWYLPGDRVYKNFPYGKAVLPTPDETAALVRQAWAETYCHWGRARRSTTWFGAFRMLTKALAWQPGRLETWKVLGSIALTKTGRRFARWCAGRSRPYLAACHQVVSRC